jgi:hypothetical protein
MKKIILFIALIFTILTYSQGCSDAGICSIGHGFDEDQGSLKNQIEVAAIFGVGESDVKYFSPYISYSIKFNEKLALSSRLTFSNASGSFGTRAAFGDAFFAGNYNFKEKNNKQWSTLLGWKLPFTRSNLKINDYSLPEDYQSSLGTFDLFLGTGFKYYKWDFTATIQIPVFNINKNSYFKEYSGTDDFTSTNLFERKSDVLLRASYTLTAFNKKITFKPNILFIYHLGVDSFENIYGIRENIIGSDGLTINGNLITSYMINKQNSIELSLATPFVVRDVRPDGLTRKYVAALLYKYSF